MYIYEKKNHTFFTLSLVNLQKKVINFWEKVLNVYEKYFFCFLDLILCSYTIVNLGFALFLLLLKYILKSQKMFDRKTKKVTFFLLNTIYFQHLTLPYLQIFCLKTNLHRTPSDRTLHRFTKVSNRNKRTRTNPTKSWPHAPSHHRIGKKQINKQNGSSTLVHSNTDPLWKKEIKINKTLFKDKHLNKNVRTVQTQEWKTSVCIHLWFM